MEPEGDVANPALLDPEGLGFMCGIEVHQQLATGKLHSRQPGELHDITIETLPEDWPKFRRKLRSSSGEGGAVDVAARFEARRNRSFVYCQSPNAGLIELDEQNTMNAMEIRKREAKVFLMTKQIEDIEETISSSKENNNQTKLWFLMFLIILSSMVVCLTLTLRAMRTP